jgi:beta-galactosidase/beta-glucuronidase
VPAASTGKQIWLNFDGINYTAEVWVNGHKLGDIRGAFVRGIFNVTPL